MAVKASVTITISKYRDTDNITRYYKLQASTAAAPAVPTTLTPSGWSTSEPTYTSGSTNTLYYTDCIVFSDGTFQYTDDGNGKAVKSSSYEAAKEAYNKAQAAQDSINDLNIGGRNLLLDSKKNTKNKTEYKVQEYTLSEDWIVNEEYTLSIKGNVTNGKFGAWRDFGSRAITYSMNYDEEKDLWWYTFKCPAPYDSTRPTNILTIYNTPDTVEHNSTIEWIKLEKGNKATDWSPAPEDIDENIETVSAYAQNIANELLSSKGQLAAASTRIDSLQGIIENFVKDDNGMVTVTQTGSGMQIDMTQATNRINQLLTAIESAITEGEAEQLRTELLTAIQAVQSRTAYINATQDSQGRPVITLGATDSPFKVEITNEAINFIQNGQVIAYANGQKFYNLRTVVQQDVQIGIGPGFIWKTRDSGNMGLTWVPAQS